MEEITGAPAPAENAQPQTINTPGTPDAGFNFNNYMSAEYRDNPSISKFGGNLDNLAKSYLSLSSMIGGEKVIVPKDANDMNAWGMYDKAFGVPEKAEDYGLTAPEGADLSEFNAAMKRNHISKAAAQDLLNSYLDGFKQIADQERQEAEAARQTAEASLKSLWGMKYQANIDAARGALEKMSKSKEDFDYFNQKVGNDPKFIELFARMGGQMSEGSLGGFEGQVSGFTKTPLEAKAEFDRIMADPNDAYFAGARNKRNDPNWCREHNVQPVTEEERKARVAYVQSLMQQMG